MDTAQKAIKISVLGPIRGSNHKTHEVNFIEDFKKFFTRVNGGHKNRGRFKLKTAKA